ncbi:unnamed protein product [Porites lobata]|uniref:Uncharacterized protein n=1 Tax=Porites lobata TaxID=104759 RepID=A0ABN8P951_9CNID|nr:unnamed protein product [Porites lobata]
MSESESSERERAEMCSKIDEDEVLGELTKLYQTEGTVSEEYPFPGKLASLVDKMVKASFSEEKTKEKYEKYNTPENCKNRTSTKVNPEIWRKVRSNTRSRDLRMKNWKQTFLRARFPGGIVKIADKLLELKSNSKSASTSDVSEFLNSH